MYYDKKENGEVLSEDTLLLLYLIVFNSFVIYRKHGGKYTYLQFHMHIVQKLFETYRGATLLEVLLVIAMRTILPDPSGRFSGRHFLNVNPSTGTVCETKVKGLKFSKSHARRDAYSQCYDFSHL
jgi:hypothetical protein